MASLLDLSRFGCRLASKDECGAGEPVRLRFHGGHTVDATVVWSDDAMIGCRFDAPIARALTRSVLLGEA